MNKIYRGTDFIGNLQLDRDVYENFMVFEVKLYTQLEPVLTFNADTEFNAATGGLIRNDKDIAMSLYVPSDVLKTLKDGVLMYDVMIGIPSISFPDGIQNIVLTGSFNIELCSLNNYSNGI